MGHLPFRQIHLDFHTSGKIPAIASQFDAKTFADTLENARVNSVCCFSRCHHGLMYFDSTVHPERIHPNLTNPNLLSEQVSELHKRGIRANIYTSIQWDEFTSKQHPEWLVVDSEGKPTAGPYDATFRHTLCVNTPYRDFLKAHIADIFDHVPVDGLFLDIVHVHDCSCRWCRADMQQRGIDASDKTQRLQFAFEMMDEFKRDLSAFIRDLGPECEIFYNAGHIAPSSRSSLDSYNHLEAESLPSGEWGYDHFPVVVRYARTLDKELLGMTGKFHTSWADFHSFKNQPSLEYEIFHMLAMNVKCSIGDQLHPNGLISPETYELIGNVYSQVEQKEPWCEGAKAITDIGVLNPEEFNQATRFDDQADSLRGVTKILVEGGQQFDIIDTQSELENYKLIILPDELPLDEALSQRLENYCNHGGKILATYKGGLTPAGDSFASDLFGVKLVGDAPFSPDFLKPEGYIGQGLRQTEHVMYQKGLQVDALPGSEVLCETYTPYFNRTWEHYCSHMHAPSTGEVGYPGIVKNDNVIYFMHPVFSQYIQNAPYWVKRLVLNAIDTLLPQPILKHNGPKSVISAVNEQSELNRAVVHLLHYIPESKSDETLIIEDIIPLHQLDVSVKVNQEVKSVRLIPENNEITFNYVDSRLVFTVPKLEGHQMIELAYK
ncbi:beta-galactosidase [Photobacterium rosenbergii]|uniref:Beta-galactosidase n=1 Tax=Photobacterium rosenbergii TaxID=294936 RepID=A0A2T3N9N5_9GAMM|nr:alpha-amylase family protein [Photobacterium rosenbergii]PSW10249.1 beta-galactosidase [Photobacterium rosenbergii]